MSKPMIEKPCKYVLGAKVICNASGSHNRKCHLCGWNPNVAYARKQAAREKLRGGQSTP